MLRETEALLARYRAAGKRIATAESCTGWLIAGCLTEIPGSSHVVDRGFVTYSNASKSEMLGISPTLLEHPGPGAGKIGSAHVCTPVTNANLVCRLLLAT